MLNLLVLDEKNPSDEPVVKVEAGESGWRIYTGRFKSPRLRRNKGLMPMTLRIESTASGNVWPDDIAIERVEDDTQAESPSQER